MSKELELLAEFEKQIENNPTGYKYSVRELLDAIAFTKSFIRKNHVDFTYWQKKILFWEEELAKILLRKDTLE